MKQGGGLEEQGRGLKKQDGGVKNKGAQKTGLGGGVKKKQGWGVEKTRDPISNNILSIQIILITINA